MRAATARIATALIGATALAGCVSINDHRGAVIDTQLFMRAEAILDDALSQKASA